MIRSTYLHDQCHWYRLDSRPFGVPILGHLPTVMKEWAIFVAALMSGLDRIAFVQKKYSDAERWYGDVVARFANSRTGSNVLGVSRTVKP